MTVDVVMVGAGGFGRECLDVIEALAEKSVTRPYRVVGVVDDRPSAAAQNALETREVPWLGTLDDLLMSGRGDVVVIAIGNPSTRARISEVLNAGGLEPAPAIVHPAATIGTHTRLGVGSVVCGGAQVSTNVVAGTHAQINPNATVGHDVTLGHFVSINPGAIVSGDVCLGDAVLLGAGAVVLQGLAVGAGVTIGAAACVTKDVEAGMTVKGIPAR